MKAGEILINGIFNGSRLLEIPFYQRKYVWEKEQWERFLEDMEFITKTNRPYFLGSIILKNGETMGASDEYSEKRIVIDGQQRLTTLVLFMKVLCLMTDSDDLFRKDFILEKGSIALQHGKNDIDAFSRVVNAASIDEIKKLDANSRIVEAAHFFIDNIKPDKVNRMRVKTYTQFVCIDLLDGEDEQQVFDTINSLGVRLTTAELLKNYFFHRDDLEEYKEKWESVFEKDEETKEYWEQEFEVGRVKRSLIDIFLDSYFQLFVQNKSYDVKAEDKIAYARVGHLSQSYQSFIKEYCNGNKNIVTDPMKEYAENFRLLFNPQACSERMPKAFGMERMNVIIFGLKTTTVIPYIMYIKSKIQDEEQFNRMLQILETYIMRRMIVHATTKNYNNIFTSLILNNIVSEESLIDRLQNSTETTTYIPNDNELLEGFKSSKLINLQTRGILYFIESTIHPKNAATILLGFDEYSLEHLMPKKWRNNWEACKSEEEAWERDRTLLTLGNLAIIPQSLNASIRDADWDTKRKGKGNNPGLRECAAGLLTVQNVLDVDNWNEDEIKQRAEWLYKKAAAVWSL